MKVKKFLESFYLVLLSFSFILPADKLAGQTKWNKIDTPPFQVFYASPDENYAQELSALLTSARTELTKIIGLEFTKPVKIYLCSSERVFVALTGSFIPHWGAGVADPIRSVVVLKSPRVTDDPENFPKLVRHELVHILIGQATKSPGALPRWFSEGIAILFSYDEQFASGKAISKALISNSIVPLDEIDDVLKFHQARAVLAYEESYSFTRFLQEKFGLDKLLRLIQMLNNRTSFENAFSEVFGADIFELELEWYEFLEKKYRWRFLLDFEIFLWIFILFLFMFVFIAIRLRNRRVMNKWEEEEGLANQNF